MLYSLQKDLERGQPLLAVDYLTPWQASCGGRLLFENNCSKEVACDNFIAFPRLQAVQNPYHVIPQGFPLVFPVPDVGPLKERHGESLILAENLGNRNV